MASTTSNLGLKITDIADLFKDLIDHLRANFTKLDSLFHVGRIIITADPDWDPNAELGGSWVRIADRVLVGVGPHFAAGTEGGSLAHYHRTASGFDGKNFFGWLGRGGDSPNNGVPYFGSEALAGENSLTSTESSAYVNRDNVARVAYTESVSSMPPYSAVFIWKRVG